MDRSVLRTSVREKNQDRPAVRENGMQKGRHYGHITYLFYKSRF